MKLIAYYLPQFHEIEENNRAWGKGFTEWDNVKKSVPLYEGHYQPREPLNNNYYNLLNPDVMKWQIDLAKKYGLYGFCFYHYWFRDGKKVLERPTEMLLKHTEWEMPFCFAWANEPWTKTWHGAAGEKEVLIEQRYGKEEQWKQHFEYFVPFFKDARYIKIDNKPVVLIYQISKIGCFNRMIDYWNKLAEENEFEGIYIVDMLTADGKRSNNKRIAASVDFEPGKTKRKLARNETTTYSMLSYDDSCLNMLNEKHVHNEFRCMFVDYDDSPRRGERGCIYQGSSPEKFGMYLQKAIQLAEEEDNEYVFINAWNEWGEGNYLEPDKSNEFAYLEAMSKAIYKEYEDVILDGRNSNLVYDKVEEKFRRYYDLCNQWLKVCYDGYCIDTYFREHGYKKIAIYGMGELANRLIEALQETDIEISYGIDKNMWQAFAEIDIVGMDECNYFGDVDCIVVTPIHIYEEIKECLKEKCNCDIISLEDVMAGL